MVTSRGGVIPFESSATVDARRQRLHAQVAAARVVNHLQRMVGQERFGAIVALSEFIDALEQTSTVPKIIRLG